MGMGTGPASAYVIDLDEVKVFDEQIKRIYLSDEHTSEEEINAYKDGDDDYRKKVIENFLLEVGDDQRALDLMIDGHEYTVEVMHYDRANSGDIYDDLTDGFYLVFGEGELFSRSDKDLMRHLRAEDAVPKPAMWTWFG